jgi:hypothetical protein
MIAKHGLPDDVCDELLLSGVHVELNGIQIQFPARPSIYTESVELTPTRAFLYSHVQTISYFQWSTTQQFELQFEPSLDCLLDGIKLCPFDEHHIHFLLKIKDIRSRNHSVIMVLIPSVPGNTADFCGYKSTSVFSIPDVDDVDFLPEFDFDYTKMFVRVFQSPWHFSWSKVVKETMVNCAGGEDGCACSDISPITRPSLVLQEGHQMQPEKPELSRALSQATKNKQRLVQGKYINPRVAMGIGALFLPMDDQNNRLSGQPARLVRLQEQEELELEEQKSPKLPAKAKKHPTDYPTLLYNQLLAEADDEDMEIDDDNFDEEDRYVWKTFVDKLHDKETCFDELRKGGMDTKEEWEEYLDNTLGMAKDVELLLTMIEKQGPSLDFNTMHVTMLLKRDPAVIAFMAAMPLSILTFLSIMVHTRTHTHIHTYFHTHTHTHAHAHTHHT